MNTYIGTYCSWYSDDGVQKGCQYHFLSVNGYVLKKVYVNLIARDHNILLCM